MYFQKLLKIKYLAIIDFFENSEHLRKINLKLYNRKRSKFENRFIPKSSRTHNQSTRDQKR